MCVLGATEVQAKKGFGSSLEHVHYVYVWAVSALPPLPAETWSRHQQSTGSHWPAFTERIKPGLV